MSIKNVKVKNSRIGVHQGKSHEVCQLVTIIIQYNGTKMVDKEILVGLRKRTTLKFIADTYFGTFSKNMLELWSMEGDLLKTIPKPKGKIIDTYNNWYITQNDKVFEAYDILGEKVAMGELTDDNEIKLYPINKIE